MMKWYSQFNTQEILEKCIHNFDLKTSKGRGGYITTRDFKSTISSSVKYNLALMFAWLC